MSIVLLARRFLFSRASARSSQLPRASAAIFCQRDILSRTVITKSGSNEICNSQAAKHLKESFSNISRRLVSHFSSLSAENAPLLYKEESVIEKFKEVLSDEERFMKKFKKWSVKFNRVYKSPEEQERRFKIFKQTVAKVNAYNSLLDWDEPKFGLTEFADMTLQEIPATHLLPPRQKQSHYANYPWLVCSLPNEPAQSNENFLSRLVRRWRKVLSPVVYEEEDDSHLMKMYEECIKFRPWLGCPTGLEKEVRFKMFKKNIAEVNARNEMYVLKADDYVDKRSIRGCRSNMFSDLCKSERKHVEQLMNLVLR